jgi:hypothetical protein
MGWDGMGLRNCLYISYDHLHMGAIVEFFMAHVRGAKPGLEDFLLME